MTEPVSRSLWRKAVGKCGFNVAGPVWAAYINRVALFAWQDKRFDGRWTCAVTGQLSCSGKSLSGAQVAGETYARRYGTKGADRRMTRKQFDKIVNTPDTPRDVRDTPA